ncbi:MAG: hypothetical protein AUJ98_07495 [Bacteroidetes bacterium CG2_30_33_31]|nr:MAG: hypothetical protein AUJ98_07495 [Bacteroidetes bacterium CG2_30_33_31]
MDKDKLIKMISWLYLAVVLFSAYLISYLPDYNRWFIIFLVFNFLLALAISSRTNNYVLIISRILIGLLFIYSGFVKGLDPLGFQYRIEDYFYAYNLAWALPSALFLSILLNAIEFSLGVLLLFNLRVKWVSIITLLVMFLFTATTLNDALNNPVPDCGCFGDALIISNWQTLYKNLVIDALVILIFLHRHSFENRRSLKFQNSSIILAFTVFVIFEIYSIMHQPIIDFRPWKEGTKLIPDNLKESQYYFTYKNTNSGELKEYLNTDLPWEDSIFMKNWTYVSTREQDPNVEQFKTFPLIDSNNVDISKEVVSSTSPSFLMVVTKMADANEKALKKFDAIYEACKNRGWNFYILSADVPEDLALYRKKYSLANYPVLNADDTSLKAAIRANPGLIVVKSAVVLKKYNYRDIPEPSVLINLFNK